MGLDHKALIIKQSYFEVQQQQPPLEEERALERLPSWVYITAGEQRATWCMSALSECFCSELLKDLQRDIPGKSPSGRLLSFLQNRSLKCLQHLPDCLDG